MTTTEMQNWTIAGRADAEAMASESGRPVIWVADALHGFARLLRDGETREQAIVEFETAGEPADRSEVYE